MAALPSQLLAFSKASFFLGHCGDLAPCGPRQFGHLLTTCTQATPTPCTPRHRTCARPFGARVRMGHTGGFGKAQLCTPWPHPLQIPQMESAWASWKASTR